MYATGDIACCIMTFIIANAIELIRKLAFQLVSNPGFSRICEDNRKALLCLLPVECVNAEVIGQGTLCIERTVRDMIVQGGGIFIGKEELVRLQRLAPDAMVPEIPEKFSTTFLSARHPFHHGAMANHVILGFDADTDSWYCFERHIIPNSIGL